MLAISDHAHPASALVLFHDGARGRGYLLEYQKPENIDTGRPPATFPFNFGPKTGQ